MKIVIFCHSLVSDWNHGNAHFLRGLAAELLARGHDVCVLEPDHGWSRAHLRAQQGSGPEQRFAEAFPRLTSVEYALERLDLDRALDGAQLVLAHEWNDPRLLAALSRHRAHSSHYRLLFHDTHHRMVSAPEQMQRLDLSGFDGVLAFGEVIRALYLERGLTQRAWTFHEAADTRVFRPRPGIEPIRDLAWVGNWGDGERSAELREFLLGPARTLRLSGTVHGVRYPLAARLRIRRSGLRYRGWVANHMVPSVFARHRLTVHVPRRPYVRALPGIPTIRVFEALACGIPLICAPWEDAEHLFTPGRDFMLARDRREMTRIMRLLLNEPVLAAGLAAHGRATVCARHTCSHRASQLLEIHASLAPAGAYPCPPAATSSPAGQLR